MEKSIGLIGIGAWGKKLAKESHELGILSCVLKSSQNEATEWIDVNVPGVRIMDSIEDIFNNPDIKGVIIATPIDTHFKIALKTLQSNKHVFLEKPGTDSVQKLNELIQEANKRNLILQIGYEFVYSNTLREIKDKIVDKKIESIAFKWHKWGSFKAHPMINLLVHEISILKFLGINSLENIKYSEEKIKEITESTIPEILHIEAQSDGIQISFDINIASKDQKEHLIVIKTTDEQYEWKDTSENLIQQELKTFISSIKNNSQPQTNGIFAREILDIIEIIKLKN